MRQSATEVLPWSPDRTHSSLLSYDILSSDVPSRTYLSRVLCFLTWLKEEQVGKRSFLLLKAKKLRVVAVLAVDGLRPHPGGLSFSLC